MRRAVRRHPSPAMVIAFIALLAALSGTAVALPGKNTVDSGDIKRNAVKSADIGRRQVKNSDLGSNSVSSVKIRPDAVTGADVSEASLGKVPSATTADSAARATTADSATTVSNGAITPAKFATLPAARAVDSDGQSLPDSSTTPIALDSETFDTASLHDNATNNSRLTAPVDGTYIITGSVRWANNTTGRRIVMISHSADGQIARDAVSPNNTSGFGPEQDVDTVYRLAAGQFVELHAFQDSGGALGVEDFGPSSPVLAMTWVGP